ncbi:MAG: chromosome segregation SMC family protein, partial [Pseudomonadota bacterium]
MKFTKLRLLGFKSFVEPTEFQIEDGLTGVVGPNGCGKSNLVEALRWVMGENSYKNMRASGMDDVIFSGSGNRPARNTAEVSLFLDNSDRTAPAAFNDTDELQVSRRIERESGSVYRINGKDVRAKDVQLLFADASTGARSPSMVGQGRIGELISAKPQARRALLEEAAGISGLHSRRHDAELRLRAAESNLEKLDDVVGQLDSQLESLKRQARQANRYRNLSGEIRKTEALLFHLKWMAAKASEAAAQSALSAQSVTLAERAEKQGEAARLEAIAAQKLPGLRDEEAKAAAVLQRLQIAKAQLEEEVSRLEFRRAELENRHSQLMADLQREEQILADNNLTVENLNVEQAELEDASRNVAEVEAQSRAELEKATAALGESEAAFSDLTVKLADQNARRKQVQRTLEEARNRQERLEEQSKKIATDLSEILAEINSLEGPVARQKEVDQFLAKLQEVEASYQKAEAETAIARQAEQQLRKPLEEAEGSVRELETEARTLRQILNRGGQELFPSILERITIKPGYETALGAALGDDLEASLDDAAAIYWSGTDNLDADPDLPEGVTSFLKIMQAPVELSRRLSQTGIVEKPDGERLSKLLKPGQRIVTRDGDMWRWDGLVAGAEAPSAAAQRLAQKNRLAELDQQSQQARAAVRSAQDAYDAGKAKTAQLIEDELSARELVRETQGNLSAAREALAQAERSVSQLAAKRSALEEAKARVGEDLEETRKRVIDSDASLMAMVDMSEAEAELEALRMKVAEDRARLAEARAASQGLSREAEARGRRLEVIKSERENWQKRLKNATGQIETLTRRRDETAVELAKLANAPDEFDAKRRGLMNELQKAEENRSASADALARAETEQADADKIARKAVDELAGAREQVGRAEERLNASVERRKEIELRIR